MEKSTKQHKSCLCLFLNKGKIIWGLCVVLGDVQSRTPATLKPFQVSWLLFPSQVLLHGRKRLRVGVSRAEDYVKQKPWCCLFCHLLHTLSRLWVAPRVALLPVLQGCELWEAHPCCAGSCPCAGAAVAVLVATLGLPLGACSSSKAWMSLPLSQAQGVPGCQGGSLCHPCREHWGRTATAPLALHGSSIAAVVQVLPGEQGIPATIPGQGRLSPAQSVPHTHTPSCQG